MAGWKRIGASLLCIALVAPAAAQPGGKVMRIVVPFAAGGAREVLARTFYSELGAALGQTAIIDNRPGAGGAIGTASVARAAPDGQTLIFAASSHNVTALLGANPPYDPIRDFAGVANIGMQSYVLMASAAVPAKNVAELLGYARANPGKLNYASAGHGSSGHLAMPLAVPARGAGDRGERRSRIRVRLVVRAARAGAHAQIRHRAHQRASGKAAQRPRDPRAAREPGRRAAPLEPRGVRAAHPRGLRGHGQGGESRGAHRMRARDGMERSITKTGEKRCKDG